MQRPCDIAFNECPGTDSPVTNASSEAPDPLLFAGTGWTVFDRFRPIPIGDGLYYKTDCTNITWSAESQEMADLLAQIASAFCQPPPPPSTDIDKTPTLPPNPNPVIPPFIWEPGSWIQPDPQLQMFANDRQEASVNCPDGSIFTMAIEAGTATALLPPAVGPSWVEYINAYLLAYILQRIWDLRVCVTVPNLPGRTPPGIPPGPTPGPGTPATFSAFPGWCCDGAELDPQFCTYNITGGSPSAVWTFSLTGGSIPAGTSLIQTGPKSAVLDGAPSATGTYAYTITAVSGSTSIVVNDTLNVVGITESSLPDSIFGSPYSEQLHTSGTTAPVTFSIVGGSLPPGFSLSSTGEISCPNPATAGSFSFDVQMSDSAGMTCSKTFSLNVTGAAALGYQICCMTNFASDLTGGGFTGCGFDVRAAWGGLFDTLTSSGLGYPIYYFTGFRAPGAANFYWVSADGIAGWPAPAAGWQDTEHYSRLSWDGTKWVIRISCLAQAGPQFIWVGNGPATIGDAAGTYTRDGALSLSGGPATALVARVEDLMDPTFGCIKGCPDWSAMTWPVATNSDMGSGLSTFSPSPGTGVSIASASAVIGGPGQLAAISNTGTVMYTSSVGCNCNLHMEVSSYSDPPGDPKAGYCSANVSVYLDGVLVVTHDIGTSPDGSYDFNFTMPPSGCVALPVTVVAGTSIAVSPPGLLMTTSLLATLTNI